MISYLPGAACPKPKQIARLFELCLIVSKFQVLPLNENSDANHRPTTSTTISREHETLASSYLTQPD